MKDNNNIFDPENLTPEQDFAICVDELNNGNLQHALFHLSCALSSNPKNKEWLSVLDKLCNNYDNLLEFLPSDNNYFAFVAVKAYFLWKKGNYSDAINMLSQVMKFVPNVPYILWLENWLREDKAIDDIDENTFYVLLSAGINAIDVYVNNGNTYIVDKLTDIFSYFQEPEKDSVFTKYMAMSMLKRRTKEYNKALQYALEGYNKFKTAQHATFVGLCYKEMNDIENMEKYINIGVELNPENVSGFNDMADVFLYNNIFDKAVEYYKLLLDTWPDDEWALPSYYFARLKNDSEDEEARELLIEYYKNNPENQRAKSLIQCIDNEDEEIFYDYIPTTGESLINLFHQLYNQKVKDINNLACSCLESPSAVNSIILYISDYRNKEIDFHIGYNSVPNPNPMISVEENFVLWKYDEKYNVISNVKKPQKKISDLVYSFAISEYKFPEWYKIAKEESKHLTINDIDDIYGAMVYPPEPEFEICTDIWLQRVQYACVFLLAHIDKQEGKPSKALSDICKGQLDWPVIPAMLILAYQAIMEPDIQWDVMDILGCVGKRIYKDTFCYFELPYVYSILMLPNLDDDLRDKFEDWYNSLLED